MATSETKVLTLSEEEFNEYKKKGYFRGIKYRWTSQDGSYTVYISKSSYDKLRQNMESGSTGLAKIVTFNRVLKSVFENTNNKFSDPALRD